MKRQRRGPKVLREFSQENLRLLVQLLRCQIRKLERENWQLRHRLGADPQLWEAE